MVTFNSANAKIAADLPDGESDGMPDNVTETPAAPATRKEKKNKNYRRYTSLSRDEDPNIHSGMQVAYQEGTGYMIHKQHPDYFHVPDAAEHVARYYIDRHVKPGDTEEDHSEAVRLFGISRNRNGDWVYNREHSLLANTPTLGDDMQIPIRSRVWKDTSSQKSYNIQRGLKVSSLVYKPETICGFDQSGEWSQDPKDRLFHETNCDSDGHAPGCMIDKRKIGQYKGRNGEIYQAEPLKIMNEAQSFMRQGIVNMLTHHDFNAGDYMGLMKRASQYILGRANKEKDPTTDGRGYHGIAKGAKPWFGQNHINGLINNIHDFYEVDEGRCRKEDIPYFKQRLAELRTAKYTACFCPFCTIDGQKRLGGQWHDVQHHVAAASSEDGRVKDAYFHCVTDKKGRVISRGFHLNDLPDGMGSMQEFGEVGKRTPHRVLFYDRDFKKTIAHYARHNFEEKREPSGWLRPRMMRVGEIVTRGFSLNPQSIADRLAIDPEVTGSTEE